MKRNINYRVVPPKKRDDKIHGFTYDIPCKVLNIGERLTKSKVQIDIEHADFITGRTIVSQGYTYNGTLELFNGLNLVLPIPTACRVVKLSKGKYELKVIGLYNDGVVENMFKVQENILDNDEAQIIDVFRHNYKELLEWLND